MYTPNYYPVTYQQQYQQQYYQQPQQNNGIMWVQGEAAQTQALEQRLSPNPIPAYVVQNPNAAYSYGCCAAS